MSDNDEIPEVDTSLENPAPPPAAEQPTTPTWQGDEKYFQTGKKAGKLKPVRVASPQPSGLDFDGLKHSGSFGGNNQPQQPTQPAPPSPEDSAREKKTADARVAAKLVMRTLDIVVGYISGGQFGKDLTSAQMKERNAYREELDKSWAEYLQTLDVAMHPAIVAIAGSVIYVAPAFETPRGQERVNSLAERIFGKLGAMMWKRRK